MTKELTKERKEQIIDNYIQSIRQYLNVGLCEGQANGSFGEDLMRHFDIIAKCFKETTLIEHDLGLDLVTLFKALRQFFAKDLDCYCPRPISLFQDVRNEWYISWIGHYYKLKDCGKTWALTKGELEHD